MKIVIDNEKDFYFILVEHFFRVATKRAKDEVTGRYDKEWYTITREWLENKCTKEECNTVLDYYTCNGSILDCSDFTIVSKIKPLIRNFAIEKGFK